MRFFIIIITFLMLIACDKQTLNNPHKDISTTQKIYYGSFAEQPKTLDPARSYSSAEVLFTGQIYEPPLQYHYLLRPYTLEPLTATAMPKISYIKDANGKITYSLYTISIKPNTYYQPHPAFAQDKQGNYLYRNLTTQQLDRIRHLSDFEHQGTRELTAADYIYQIKRLASPQLQSPIYGFMSQYIAGLTDYRKSLESDASQTQTWLDLRKHDLPSVKLIDKYTYQIKIKGKYPQFRFWLAMPFFAPMPWEAEAFFAQPGLREKNMSLNTYPVGTGPYMLIDNDPNRQMIMIKNPNFHGEKFPSTGMPDDTHEGYLKQAGKTLPFVDKFIFSLEKENIPRWNKFLQGYYDASGIASDSFDQAITFAGTGSPELTPELKSRDIHLQTSIGTSMFYVGFNMQDDIVGGYTEKKAALRHAITFALDYDEFIQIFLNGRGINANGPIPPGIFGYEATDKKLTPQQRIKLAKQLLAKAGYPNGINPKTNKALVLNYDVPGGGADDSARFEWMRKQFAKLNVQLNIRSTQYNRYQDKLRAGNAQIFFYGWNADYPDPENFLFLYYGPNSKKMHGGENATNYNNPEFDKLFLQMRHMPNTPARQAVIDEMLTLLRQQAPAVWAFYPKTFSLQHGWNARIKPHAMANNLLKYMHIEPNVRALSQVQWNQPVFWPVLLLVLILIAIVLPIAWGFYRREYR